MKYISKGFVIEGSTEHILKIQRGNCEFQLTGNRAKLWINGRYGVAEADGTNALYVKELIHLKRIGLVQPVGEEPEGVFRALTQCIPVPAKSGKFRLPLNPLENQTLQGLRRAGLRLTIAELVFLREHDIKPEPHLFGEENRQALTETIYTKENIFDNVLEAQMEHASCRDEMVRAVLGLLKKKRIVLL